MDIKWVILKYYITNNNTTHFNKYNLFNFNLQLNTKCYPQSNVYLRGYIKLYICLYYYTSYGIYLHS